MTFESKEDTYKIIGICMEVHRILGGGLLESVYKDALEYEFTLHGIPFQREKECLITYKDTILPHRFYADFVIYGNIILEIKAVKDITDAHIAQTINYIKLVGGDIGLIINFSTLSLQHRRIVA
jgi:GxxExxY protein